LANCEKLRGCEGAGDFFSAVIVQEMTEYRVGAQIDRHNETAAGTGKGYIYILLSTILFSTMEIALKVVSNDFNPIQLTFLRFLIGSIVLIPLAVKGLQYREYRLKTEDFMFFSLTGFLCVVISMILYQMALLYSHASVVAVLFSCNPVFVVFFAFFILREKIYKHTLFSLLVSIGGIIVIMNPLHMSGSASGFILTILSAVVFALYGVIGRKRSERYGGIALTCFSFIMGSAEMLVLILISRIGVCSSFFTHAGMKSFANIAITQGINAHTIPSLVFIGVFVTGLGYTFYFLAMEATSTATASLVFFIKPALAPILALLLIHEPITIGMTIGILLIIAGSLISFIPSYCMHKNKKLNEKYEEIIEMNEDELENEADDMAVKL
jgi:drug/metabolite transporter (DMT)-like permease